MRIAVMQPYFFPYIGYFQLIKTVNKFIFYDDVNFIKNGWINRNRILLNGKPHYITIQLKNASSFSPINNIKFNDNRNKIKKTIEQVYKKAPYFKSVYPIIEDCFSIQTEKISELAIYSVIHISKFLELNTIFEISSQSYLTTRTLGRTDRLKEICKINCADQYVNPIGGMDLYDKEDFLKVGVNLNFIKSKTIEYQQFDGVFEPWLSVIDVIMFNSKDAINNMLEQYELI